jgi:hypothetical protein
MPVLFFLMYSRVPLHLPNMDDAVSDMMLRFSAAHSGCRRGSPMLLRRFFAADTHAGTRLSAGV